MWKAERTMFALPTSLRARIALVGLLGIFLVPASAAPLRGLTHLLTCSEAVEATVFIDNSTADAEDEVILGSADTIDADDPDPTLCEGLVVDFQVGAPEGSEAPVIVAITNQSDTDWQGSVDLRLGDVSLPVDIGSIDAGDTETDTVHLDVDPERTYTIDGTLRIGP